MCTMIAQQEKVSGAAKSGADWFRVDTLSVSYDHPFEMPLEYALNLDFTRGDGNPAERVAVELDADSARKLVATISEVLKKAEAGGYAG